MNLTHKLDFFNFKFHKKDIKRVFFYRIAGTGMGAAACLFKEKGFHVEGADTRFYPPMGDYLKQTGIPLHRCEDLDSEFLQSFDLIVVGNVVAGISPEARMIEELGVPFISFPSALGALVLQDVNVVGIAGTHGKTTTTYLLTQMFENLGTQPGYFIGGVIDNHPSSRLGGGKYFFIESDEYDSAYFEKISKFRMYAINHLILTSLEFDHADIFENLEAIKDQFRAGMPQVDKSFIFCEDYKASMELFEEFKGTCGNRLWSFYGENSEAGPRIIEMGPQGTSFSLKLKGKEEVFQTNVIGHHNILNLSTGIIFAFNEGFSVEQIGKSIAKLQMVKRRQEERGYYKKSLVIDDFAHHPRAVRVTVDAVKAKYPEKKINVVFEAASATARSDIFQEEFEEAFSKCDSIMLVKPPRPTSVKGVHDLNIHRMHHELVTEGKEVYVAETLEQLMGIINKKASPEGLFLVLSNGTCLGLWESDFAQKLSPEA